VRARRRSENKPAEIFDDPLIIRRDAGAACRRADLEVLDVQAAPIIDENCPVPIIAA
jgi:hypothetical protein